ncbi:MAG: DUF2314 domain-containing protein [Opitutaceae bacterium]
MSEEKIKAEDEIQVMAIKKYDPSFLEGKAEAHRTIQTFLDIHAEHKENLGVYFAIKMDATDSDGTRHFLWYTFEKEENGKLFAYHYNIPEDLKDFEKIEVDFDKISDWMINDHGYLIGGWSVRLQREKIPESERAEFDESAGIKVYRENNF